MPNNLIVELAFKSYHIACTETGLNIWVLPQAFMHIPLEILKEKYV